MNRFTENGSLKLPGASLFTGHAALLENYARTFQMEDFHLKVKVISIEISEAEDFSYAHADFEV